jgi:hypothetical protein
MYAKSFNDWNRINENSKEWSKRGIDLWKMIDLERDINSDDQDVLYRVATHPECPPEYLTELSMSWSSIVRAGVAENENTPGDVLWALSFDNDSNVLLEVASNTNAPAKAFENLINPKLSDDPNQRLYNDLNRRLYKIVLQAIKNPSCPIDLVVQVYKSKEYSNIQQIFDYAELRTMKYYEDADDLEKKRIDDLITLYELGIDPSSKGDIDLGNLDI